MWKLSTHSKLIEQGILPFRSELKELLTAAVAENAHVCDQANFMGQDYHTATRCIRWSLVGIPNNTKFTRPSADRMTQDSPRETHTVEMKRKNEITKFAATTADG